MVDPNDSNAREVNVVPVDTVLTLNNEAIVISKEILETSNEEHAPLQSETLIMILVPIGAF